MCIRVSRQKDCIRCSNLSPGIARPTALGTTSHSVWRTEQHGFEADHARAMQRIKSLTIKVWDGCMGLDAPAPAPATRNARSVAHISSATDRPRHLPHSVRLGPAERPNPATWFQYTLMAKDGRRIPSMQA